MPHQVTLLIPTIGRANLLTYVLDGLCRQSYGDFDVLVVSKSADCEIKSIVDRFSKLLDIRCLVQKQGGLIEAYNEGIHEAKGKIIMFLDDDAVPDPHCVEEHISTYERYSVSGVSGEVVPTQFVNGKLKPIEGGSEIISIYKEPAILRRIGEKLWSSPLKGQEGYLAYISKAGYSRKNIYLPRGEIVESLLCMAANMSVLASTVKGYRMPTSFLKRGIDFEQILGWKLWKNRHRTVFNPKPKVYHILHGETASRFLNEKNALQATVEDELVFYYLLKEGEKLSKMHRIVSILHSSLVHVRKIRYNWRYETSVLKGIFLGNIIGFKWLLSNKFKGAYLPANDDLIECV
jgi:glycosyltransferase involved in cell wall biosynthesis